MGLWGAFIVAVPITIFQLFGEQVLLWLNQSPSSVAAKHVDLNQH